MAFQSSVAAAHFSELAVSKDPVTTTENLTETQIKAFFATAADFTRVPDIRDMPNFGTPPNPVKVPIYGQAQTLSITAQSDAPDLQITVNYVPSKWAPSAAPTAFSTSGNLGDALGDGIPKMFQIAYLTSKNTNLHTGTAPNIGGTATAPIANTLLYFVGRLEAPEYTFARDDAATAVISMSILSEFFGPYTVTAA